MLRKTVFVHLVGVIVLAGCSAPAATAPEAASPAPPQQVETIAASPVPPTTVPITDPTLVVVGARKSETSIESSLINCSVVA
jgi:hypothetical protein